MSTKDGRAQIWYADGNGNVEGYTETVDNIAETIIGAYNEHFGTGIQIWTPETKTLQVGGTVPNWNAYEKIDMPIQGKVALILQSSITAYMIGNIENSIFSIKIKDERAGYLVTQDGTVSSTYGPTANAKNYIIGEFAKYGVTISEVVNEVVSLVEGSVIQDWADYTKLG